MDDRLKLELKETVDIFHSDRGRFLNAYAQAEYLLLDMFSYLRAIPCYTGVFGKFPFGTRKKLEYLDEIIGLQGPVLQFSYLITDMRNLLSDNEEIRNYLAHGFSKILFNKSAQMSVQLLRFNPKSDDPWKPTEIIFSFPEFRNTVSILVQKSDLILEETRNLYDSLNLQGGEPVGEFRRLKDV